METSPTFTTDWFSVWIPIWQEHVLPRVVAIEEARWLEVGSFEGRSALWTLNNLLRGKDATLTCIDTWYPEYESVFDANLKGRDNVEKLKGKSSVVLPTMMTPDNVRHFHGAYLDGSHEEEDVLNDASLVWQLLRPGAILIFDDYGSDEYPNTKKAVDSFLSRPDVGYQLIYKGPPPAYPQQSSWQVIVMKTDPSVEGTGEHTSEVLAPTETFASLLRRVKPRVSPRTIIDVGASNGSWSLMAQPFWPGARYFLIEANPVFVPDLETVCKDSRRFSYVSALAGASDGKAKCKFNKENPFQGVHLGDFSDSEQIDSVTVDSQVRERKLSGPFLLKLDVHGHELPILHGAQTTLLDTSAIVMEVYCWRQCVGSLRFWEMCSYLEYLGFGCTDFCEPLYRPLDGRLSQVDMLFERTDSPGMDTSRWI